MENLFMKNGLSGKHFKWELNTASLKKGITELTNFSFYNNSNKYIICRLDCTYNDYDFGEFQNFKYTLEKDFKYTLEITNSFDGTVDTFFTTAILTNNSNKIVHIFTQHKKINSLGKHEIGCIKENKLLQLNRNYSQQIFLNLYIVKSKVLSEKFNLSFYQDQTIPECCGEIVKSFEKIFIEDNLFSDAIIVSKNKEFKINKNIFSARSKYFSAAFKHEACGKESNKILIKNKNGDLCDDEVVVKLIRYVYTGRVNDLDQRIVIELFEIAHMYIMPQLEKICISYLKNNINDENILNILKICRLFKVDELKIEILEFIKRSKMFRMECMFSVDNIKPYTSYEIESQKINTKDAKGNFYEFKFKLKNNDDGEHYLDLEFLSNNVNSFSAFITCGFLNLERDDISGSNCIINISPNKPLKHIFPLKIFSDADISSLYSKNEKLFLNFFIWNQSAVKENPEYFDEKFCINDDKKSESFCELLKDMSNLYNDKTYSDFKIKTLDNEFNVHKNILAANSSVFFSKLCTQDQKCDDSLFIDIKTEAVGVMLNYLYTGATDKFSENIYELLELAEEYGFHRLKEECVKHVKTKL